MKSLELLQELRENVQDISLDDNWNKRYSYEQINNNNSIWLTSFTDVIALMLVFFVMMFSMSNPKEYGWITIVQSLNNEFQSGVEGQESAGAYGSVDMKRVKQQKKLSTSYLFAILKSLKEKNPILEKAILTKLPKKTKLTFNYKDIYQIDNSLQLTKNGQDIFDILIGNIGHLQNSMDIILNVSEPNIDTGLKQTAKIAQLFKKAGYGGGINLDIRSANIATISLVIHSSK